MFNNEPMTKDELIELLTSIEEAIGLVKDLSSNYDSKIHYKLLGASVVTSINSNVNSILRSTEQLKGYFLMCDEIHPIKLADYLIKKKGYDADRDAIIYYVAHYLKRNINELYRNLNKGQFGFIGRALAAKSLKKYEQKCLDRIANGVKIIRSR